MDQEKLQQELYNKNKELDVLKSNILLETQNNEKKTQLEKDKIDLEKQIQELQNQLDEFKKLEENTETNKTKKETENLKEDIPNSAWAYEIMKGSVMHTKLLTILGSETEVEAFALKINGVVSKFLDQELEGFPQNIKDSMSVGIQFSMMETLMQQGVVGSTEFFDLFASTKTDGGASSFEGIYKSFGKFGDANKFFVLANKVQNFTWYISQHKQTLLEYKNIPTLMNPNEFRKIIQSSTWSQPIEVLDRLDIVTTLSLDVASGPVNTTLGQDELYKIVDNDLMNTVITEKSIAAIQKSLKTADKLLDGRETVSDSATSIIAKVSGLLNITIPFLGNLGDLVGMKFPTDVLRKRKDSKVLNFVFGLLGFRGGLTGLHTKYIQEQLDDLDIDNEFVSSAYTSFQTHIDTTITNDMATSTWKLCGLTSSDVTTEIVMKAKVPADYAGLKKSLVDNISSATLDPMIVEKFAPNAILTTNGLKTVDTSKITEADIDVYLKYIIPKLMADDFISSDKVNKDSFALAVIGGLVGDKYFVEGIRLGLLGVADYTNASIRENKVSYVNIDETDPELVRLSTGPNENYMENPLFVQYLHSLEGKNNLPYGIIPNLMQSESGGKLYNADGKTILGSSAGAKGLFQFIPSTAKGYIVKLGYPESEYEKIFTNPIIGAKACALFLKERKTSGDNAVNMLAHYNAGPGTIGGKQITEITFSQLPRETQKYITSIGYDMLTYSGKPTIILQAQRNDPSLISPTMLQQFLLAVNTLPVANTGLEAPDGSPDILATRFDEFTLVGDSHAGGLREMSGLSEEQKKNFYYFNGYDTGQLLEKIKLQKGSILKSGIKSLILVAGANDITKGLTSQVKDNLTAIKNEIAPIQLVLSTLQYYADKTLVPDSKVDELNAIITTFAQEQTPKLPIIDINKNVSLVVNDYQNDKRHLTAGGYKKVINSIVTEVTGQNGVV